MTITTDFNPTFDGYVAFPPIKIKIKKLNENAVIPKYAKEGDAGLDLVATSIDISENGLVTYGTGLAFEIPRGYVGLIFPRSSVKNTTLELTNSVGVLDSGYRGQLGVIFRDTKHDSNDSVIYNVGDRVCQLLVIPYPEITFEEVVELSDSERGKGGWGSSGK